MISQLQNSIASIGEICEEFGVLRLEAFGSAVEGDFDAEVSDFDFLIQYPPGHDLGPWMAEFHKLRERLEKLLGRKVDLVMAGALKNPYFIKEAGRTRITIYDATNRKVA
jgi:hypothetical protein